MPAPGHISSAGGNAAPAAATRRADHRQPGLEPVQVAVVAQEARVDQRARPRVGVGEPDRAPAVRRDRRGHQGEAGRGRLAPGRGQRQQDREQVQVRMVPALVPVPAPASAPASGLRSAAYTSPWL